MAEGGFRWRFFELSWLVWAGLMLVTVVALNLGRRTVVVDALASWPWYEFPAVFVAPLVTHSIRNLGKDPWAGRALALTVVVSLLMAGSIAWGELGWEYLGWTVAFFVWHIGASLFRSPSEQRFAYQVVILALVIPSAGTFAMIATAGFVLPFELSDVELVMPESYLLITGVLYFSIMAWASPRAYEAVATKSSA